MGLLFGGTPEEVPFRRKILRSLVWEGELYKGHKTLANVYMVCRGASRATRLTG